MDPLHTLAARHFADTLTLLGGAVPDDDDDAAAARAWCTALDAPLDVRTTKYAKAVKRLLGDAATLHCAIEYRDANALADVFAAWSLTDRSSAHFWPGIATLARHALAAVGSEPPPRAPTRDEIARNIDEHRRVTATGGDGTVSVARAFRSSMIALADAMGHVPLRARVNALEDDDARAMCAEWGAGVDAELERAIRARDGAACAKAAWPVLCDDEAATLRAKLKQSDAPSWVALEGLVSFSSVSQHVPTEMMQTIEKTAQSLARDISRGKASIDTLDLEKLGQSVLANCSQTDVDALSGNLQQLLPAIGTLQGAMGKRR
jgi:hypothetical protein